jgi:biotin carboxylase
VMALARERIEAAGLATAVPSFEALAQVQDKVSACRTLARIGVPQPPSVIAASAAELADAAEHAAADATADATVAGAAVAGGRGRLAVVPVFVKTPIGTASAGVRRVNSREELRRLAEDYERLGIFAGAGGVLVQQPAAGPLVMVQAVFAGGELVAFHACERAREGVAGGASHKRGRRLPRAREQMARLGAALAWHGALSADVIDGPEGPVFIDINPRLVEPANALASGVDLTGALVQVALTGTSRPQPDGAPGTRTHQLLLAVLGAGQRGRRRDVARELADAALRRGSYRDSREELTPGRGDLLAPVPVAVAALATLAWPPAWRQFVGGSAGAYSLTPAAWRTLTEAANAQVAAS